MKTKEIIHRAGITSDLQAISNNQHKLQKVVGFIFEMTEKTPTLSGIIKVYQTKRKNKKAFFELANETASGSRNIAARFTEEQTDKIQIFGCHLPILNFAGKYLSDEVFTLKNGKVLIAPEVTQRLEKNHTIKLSGHTLQIVSWVEKFIELYNSKHEDVAFTNRRITIPNLTKPASKDQSRIELDWDAVAQFENNYQKLKS